MHCKNHDWNFALFFQADKKHRSFSQLVLLGESRRHWPEDGYATPHPHMHTPNSKHLQSGTIDCIDSVTYGVYTIYGGTSLHDQLKCLLARHHLHISQATYKYVIKAEYFTPVGNNGHWNVTSWSIQMVADNHPGNQGGPVQSGWRVVQWVLKS